MTIDEILRRVVKAHLRTILICLLVPVAVVALLDIRTPTTYVAQVRLQTTSTAPGSSTEAEGLSSRVLAIASTPGIVQRALRDAGEPAGAAHAVDVAAHAVTAERLGESSVVVLSVLDEDRGVATRTASALATRVVSFMNQGDRQQYDATMSDVKGRLAAAVVTRDKLQRELTNTDGLVARQNVQSELASAQQSVNQLQDERTALVVADTGRDNVVALDVGKPTVEPVASSLLPRTALALLLGLLVGLGLAVLKETLKPRIAGIRGLARALDAPILGSTGQLRAALAGSLTLAARRQGVETLVLVGVDDRDEKSTRMLLDSLPSSWEREDRASAKQPVRSSGTGEDGQPSGVRDPSLMMSSQVRFTDRYGVTPAEELAAGVVVVSAGNARRTGVDDVEDMVRAMRWPVVGVVEVSPRRQWLAAP
jgi:hypothetical protein